MKDYENLPSLQGLVEEYSGGCSLGGERFAPLSSTNMPAMYLSHGKTTDVSNLSRFGMTCEPLTESRGEALLMLFLAGFPVRTSALQTPKPLDLTENEAGCGEKWHGSFVKYDHDSCLWRTHQCLLFGGLEGFSETWPRWGMMHLGECWARTAPGSVTCENESGLLPTMTKETFGMWNAATLKLSNSGVRKSGAKVGVNFAWQMAMWHLQNGNKRNSELIPDPFLYENMMGFPMGWTGLQDVAMDKFQVWYEMHGTFCVKEPDSAGNNIEEA